MKNGQFALYKGKEYAAGVIDSTNIVLCSSDPIDLDRGFIPYHGHDKNIKYVKYVEKTKVTEFYSITSYVIYKGYKAYIIEEKDGKIAITINNLLPDRAQELKMDRAIDNAIYEKWIDKGNVQVLEEKTVL